MLFLIDINKIGSKYVHSTKFKMIARTINTRSK